MNETDGLICAYRLDGEGGGTTFDRWEDIPISSDRGHVWVHMDRTGDGARNWLTKDSGLRPLVQRALLAEESRPRCTVISEGVLLNLRGINLNPGAEPEDMVSVRLWLESDFIVSSRARKLMAVQDIRGGLKQGQGPKGPIGVVILLARRLTARMEPLLDEIQDRLDELEDSVLTDTRRELRTEVANLRRRTISLRRYIAPQRDALRHLATSDIDWISRVERDQLNEIADDVTRYIEDLDVIRDRAAIIHDELVNLLTERMDRTMYLLSLVAMIFLPLTLVSGMLGMNVGGIPGESTPWAFAFLCVAFLVLIAGEIWIIRKLKWI
ncbi:MAG: zinc transporter ZntB [Alphaproteobacteria bacterium]|nr:zinc transporter ZntB [Alphaproteobacteria bacterium]